MFMLKGLEIATPILKITLTQLEIGPFAILGFENTRGLLYRL